MELFRQITFNINLKTLLVATWLQPLNLSPMQPPNVVLNLLKNFAKLTGKKSASESPSQSRRLKSKLMAPRRDNTPS